MAIFNSQKLRIECSDHVGSGIGEAPLFPEQGMLPLNCFHLPMSRTSRILLLQLANDSGTHLAD